MTAGSAAWWCFMGYQTEPLRARGITRTLTALFAVWETNVTSIRRALARRQRRWECVGALYTCCVTLEQRLASRYLQLAFVPLKHFFLLVHLIITPPVLCLVFFSFSIIRHPLSNNVDVAQLMEDGENTLRVLWNIAVGGEGGGGMSQHDVCFLYTKRPDRIL